MVGAGGPHSGRCAPLLQSCIPHSRSMAVLPPSTAQLHPSTCWALGYLEPLSTDKRTS